MKWLAMEVAEEAAVMVEVVEVVAEVVEDTAARTTHLWEVVAGGRILSWFKKRMVSLEIFGSRVGVLYFCGY